MPGLLKADPIPSSPLTERVEKNTWITAPRGWFVEHMRHVAIRRPPSWSFQVVTDAQLMTAWLASHAVKGAEIFDPDARVGTASHYSLEDLVAPGELLVIYLGVKAARNSAMAEVFLEALMLRLHAGNPTWIVDQPNYPLEDGHLSYDHLVGDFVRGWERVYGQSRTPSVRKPSRGYEEMAFEPSVGGPPRPSAATDPRFARSTGGTRAVNVDLGLDSDSKKKKKPWERRRKK